MTVLVKNVVTTYMISGSLFSFGSNRNNPELMMAGKQSGYKTVVYPFFWRTLGRNSKLWVTRVEGITTEQYGQGRLV
jgi:hypothetical protein